MKIFVKEVLRRTIEVNEKDKNKAIENIKDKYKKSKIVLSADDYFMTEFDVENDRYDELMKAYDLLSDSIGYELDEVDEKRCLNALDRIRELIINQKNIY